jgi:hypothetical protein
LPAETVRLDQALLHVEVVPGAGERFGFLRVSLVSFNLDERSQMNLLPALYGPYDAIDVDAWDADLDVAEWFLDEVAAGVAGDHLLQFRVAYPIATDGDSEADAVILDFDATRLTLDYWVG